MIGRCPVCARLVDVTRAGRVRVHKAPRGGWCPGARKPVDGLRECSCGFVTFLADDGTRRHVGTMTPEHEPAEEGTPTDDRG